MSAHVTLPTQAWTGYPLLAGTWTAFLLARGYSTVSSAMCIFFSFLKISMFSMSLVADGGGSFPYSGDGVRAFGGIVVTCRWLLQVYFLPLLALLLVLFVYERVTLTDSANVSAVPVPIN